MPNIKNAKKAVLVQEKKNKINNTYKASLKTAIKKLEKSIEQKNIEEAKENLNVVMNRLDKALTAKVVTSNYVARNKSRLTKKVNEMK
jgi:small subunit ribosomal protein S20